MNIAIVVSEFNNKVTSRMHKVALEKARELKLNVKYECKVLGVFDMPLVIDTLLQKKDIDGIVTLGAIIKGQTKHEDRKSTRLNSSHALISYAVFCLKKKKTKTETKTKKKNKRKTI